jgi:hypothetical protein
VARLLQGKRRAMLRRSNAAPQHDGATRSEDSSSSFFPDEFEDSS